MSRHANSHVNDIPDVSIDDAGFITTLYGRYHPVTGEGLDFDIPEDLWNTILTALIDDGLDSGPAVEWDLDQFLEEMHSTNARDFNA